MRQYVRFTWIILVCFTLAACSRTAPRLGGDVGSAPPAPTSALVQAPVAGTVAPVENPAVTTASSGPTIQIQTDGPARPFDRRLLGTNLPAWVGPDTLRDETFQARTTALGATLLRLPGGSWSNAYDWLACENGDTQGCAWPWAARPTDFLNFLRATGHSGMWTVSINGTAQEAAALVAFFNGSIDDQTLIGVDVRGRDWQTVGHWARLRSEHGNPEPLPILLWEVGNEVYGGKPANGGAECAPWGWEEVWTCDGMEYVNGVGEGAERHEGYLEFRTAMRAVDPAIQVGAVGVDQPDGWSNWGNEVIDAAGEQLDFYVVHHYAYDKTPPAPEVILAQPRRTWPRLLDKLKGALAQQAGGSQTPIAVTEYNLVAFQDLDTNQFMRRAVNALFVADTLGQLAEQGVIIANQWDLANGRAENGTDYGLIDPTSGARSPQYYALLLWSRFGDELLPVNSTLPTDTDLSLYAGHAADGSLRILAINKTAQSIDATIQIGSTGTYAAQADTMSADALTAEQVLFNGVADPADDLSDAPARQIESFENSLEQSFPAFSITLLQLTPTS